MCEACVIQFGFLLSLLFVFVEILLIVSGSVRFSVELLGVLISVYIGYHISKKPLRREDIAYDTIWKLGKAKIHDDDGDGGPFVYMYSGFMIYSSYIIRAKVILTDLNRTNPFSMESLKWGTYCGDETFGMFVKNLDTAEGYKSIIEIAEIGWMDALSVLIRDLRGMEVSHEYFDKSRDYRVVYRT